MLKLDNIKKDYYVAKEPVHALKGITITFRENEFVSVLGPSGCGKTTLLNIIGGLDHATDGDLLIDNISTKEYKDRDWDTYRNHRVGFIFQSYNLIPHQTVLENVELALKISGFPKEVIEKKAKEALDKVGLADQYKKKPNQLSGGQCQRVAIARALVNDPEILLADEPTGALDTKTSVQIMDLIKEISKETLVIMVTHNPDLANKYSTRIINLLDGEVTGDSNPYNGVKEENINKLDKNITTKAKLKLGTTFNLSLRNLLSKVKRTLLVCFAGSIGIVGVASVLSVSNGVKGYISKMQNDMLSGNPVTITEQTIDTNSLLNSINLSQQKEITQEILDQLKNEKKINVNNTIESLLKRAKEQQNLFAQNEITEDLVNYIESINDKNVAAIKYDYGFNISNNIYTNFQFNSPEDKGTYHNDDYTQFRSITAATNIYKQITSLGNQGQYSSMSSYLSMLSNPFSILPSNKEEKDRKYIEGQYDVVAQNPNLDHVFPTNEDEIMLVIDQKSAINDIFLAQVGYYSQDEFLDILSKAQANVDKDTTTQEIDSISWEKVFGKEFRFYYNDALYTANPNYKIQDPSALIPPVSSTGQCNYKDNEFTIDINYGTNFKFNYEGRITKSNNNNYKSLKITSILRPKKDLQYYALDSGFYYNEKLAKQFIEDSKNSALTKDVKENGNITTSVNKITTYADEKQRLNNKFPQYMNGIGYKDSFTFPEKDNKTGYAVNFLMPCGASSTYSSIISMIGSMVPALSSMEGTESYSNTLHGIGGNSIPTKISIYHNTFEEKAVFLKNLDKWNEDGGIKINGKEISKEERKKLTYLDSISVIIKLIQTMIDIVTAALVSFTALSLIVSTVMIAIITYVSVIERIKEIGVIRSLGGRKGDISRLFIAETFLEGTTSGFVGLAISYLLCVILNIILGNMFKIWTIGAMTWWIALIMLGVSIILTVIAGLVPARMAAKKDPVDALRTE